MAPILVVDDEAQVREFVCRWLTAAGYECVEAESALTALQSMDKSVAPVVLTDIQMPGEDGLWLTRELRASFPTTAVILATGVSTVPPAISMQFGVMAYIVKPLQREKVLAAVKQAVAWHEDAVKNGVTSPDADVLGKWLDSLD
jgi:DNA-binding NtrC family response regulator